MANSHHEFTPPRHGARHQQIGHIGAGHEKQQTHHGKQRVERFTPLLC